MQYATFCVDQQEDGDETENLFLFSHYFNTFEFQRRSVKKMKQIKSYCQKLSSGYLRLRIKV